MIQVLGCGHAALQTTDVRQTSTLHFAKTLSSTHVNSKWIHSPKARHIYFDPS